MKYFYDCEFIEGFHKPLFGKKRHYIDLVSIGIVDEAGNKFYRISNEFDPYLADDWVTENVLKPIYEEEVKSNWHRYKYDVNCPYPQEYSHKNMKKLIKVIGSSHSDIILDLLKFIYKEESSYPESTDSEFLRISLKYGWGKKIQLYSYYSDYDHVLLSSLFGTMIDQPADFPMYTIDLKQILDERVNNLGNNDFFTHFHESIPIAFWKKLELVKENPNYPQEENAHNALGDAIFNKNLYNFLQTIK